MIGGDRDDSHLQLANPHPVQEVFDAMVEFGDHQQNLARRIRIADLPVHRQPFRNRREYCSQRISIGRSRQSLKHRPHEELRIFTIIKLLRFKDVATVTGQKARHSRNQPRCIGAGQSEGVTLRHRQTSDNADSFACPLKPAKNILHLLACMLGTERAAQQSHARRRCRGAGEVDV